MFEDAIRDPTVLCRIRSSGFTAPIRDVAQYLCERGYASRVIHDYLRVVGHFAYWLHQEGVSLPLRGRETSRRFLDDHLPGCRCPVPCGTTRRVRPAMGHLLRVLQHNGQIPPAPEPLKKPRDSVIEEFDTYLRRVRGAAPATCRQYTRYVCQFLQAMYGDHPVDLAGLKPNHLIEYITGRVVHGQLPTAKSVVTALRALLRFMEWRGLCPRGLAAAVPAVPHRRLATLPRSLTREQLTRLLRAFDRRSPVGRRNYAMALCLARLGLRAGEVAAITLDDLDWRAATLQISSGKARRVNRLPLPHDAGQAIVAYLRQGRPASRERRVFVRHRPPVGAPISSQVVQAAIRRACTCAGLTMPFRGTHVLRHTVATQMVRGGASLKEVADVLGHRCLDTTFLYTKVDVPTLTTVVMAWPEVSS